MSAEPTRPIAIATFPGVSLRVDLAEIDTRPTLILEEYAGDQVTAKILVPMRRAQLLGVAMTKAQWIVERREQQNSRSGGEFLNGNRAAPNEPSRREEGLWP